MQQPSYAKHRPSARLPKLASALRDELRLLRRGEFRRLARHTWRYIKPIRSDYRRRMRMTLAEWISYHQKVVLAEARCRWLGVQTQKNPLDAWIYQEILFETKPDVVVEIGGWSGGSALFLASLMDTMDHGELVSVDCDRSEWEVDHPRVKAVTGYSTDPETLAEVRRLCEGKTVMVIQDADHYRDAVLADLRAYAPLVSPGHYFIVEDGIMDVLRPGSHVGSFEPGALAATEQFVRENPDFEVDTERERYLITWNPRGFLRRVR